MKISIKQDLDFDNNSNIKVDNTWLSVTEPGFSREESKKTIEICGSKLGLPKDLKNIFNPLNKRIIVMLQVDHNHKKKLVAFINRSK